MKKLFIITVISFVSVIGNAQILKAELTATGLTCSMCSKATYKQLISISAVEKVEPDLNNQSIENNSSFQLDNSTYTVMDTKSATLTGEVKAKILDKGYIVEKEYKQISKMKKNYPSYATNSKNLYHIKVL